MRKTSSRRPSASAVHHVGEDVLAVVLGREGRAGADRVIDRGDAGRRHLRVMDERGRQPVRPEHLRPRHEVLFHVVGVHLDQARRDIVAADVDGAGQAGAALVDGE